MIVFIAPGTTLHEFKFTLAALHAQENGKFSEEFKAPLGEFRLVSIS